MQYFPQMFVERDNAISIALGARDTILATQDTIVKFLIEFIGPNLNLNSQVNLHDYRYVVVLCKPATVTFGYAELK